MREKISQVHPHRIFKYENLKQKKNQKFDTDNLEQFKWRSFKIKVNKSVSQNQIVYW